MTCQAHRGIVCSYPQENCPCLALLSEHVPQRLDACGMCEGSGVETFNIVVYEPGCYFTHDSTDERPCPECNGNGFTVVGQP
jgi:hypothetical protein